MKASNVDCTIFPYDKQPTYNTCETTCMKNILGELAKRHSAPKINLGLKKINKMYDYQLLAGSKTALGVNNLRRSLRPHGYEVKEVFGDKSNVELLGRIIKESNCSYPVVAVSPAFFDNETTVSHRNYRTDSSNAETRVEYEHAIIVIDVDDEITFCDPMENYKRHGACTLTKMGSPTFVRLWNEIESPKWVVWIEKIKGTLRDWGVQ